MDGLRDIFVSSSVGGGGPSRDHAGLVRVVLCVRHDFLRVGLRVLLETQAGMTVVGESAVPSDVRAFILLGVDIFVGDALPTALDLKHLLNERIPFVLLVGCDVSREHLAASLDSGVRGLVPHDADVAALTQAIRAVRDGRTWVAAALTHQLLARSRAPGLSADGMERLTRREWEILSVMSDGLSNKEIATHLSISQRTVKFHVSNVLAKLGLCSRAQAMALVHSSGFRCTRPDQRTG